MDTRHPIARWLERMKWSQARLAQEAGLSASLLCKYLAGQVGLSPDSARAIRDVTGLSLDSIYEQDKHVRGSISLAMGGKQRGRKAAGR